MAVSRPRANTLSAACPGAVAVGDVVSVVGIGSVDVCDVADPARVAAVAGVVISKPTATTAFVQTLGELPAGVVSGLSPGAVYVGADARPSSTRPAGTELIPRWTIRLGFASAPDRATVLPVVVSGRRT